MERVLLNLTREFTSLTIFLTTFVAGLILVQITKHICNNLGITDQPDGKLKVHNRKVVSLGGIPIFLALLISYALTVNYTDISLSNPTGIFAAALIILGVGVYDDIFQIRPFTKLCFQICAALTFIFTSMPFFNIDFFGIFDVTCGAFAIPLALFWLVGSCNAFNFIDGMDGLAAGVSLIICITLTVAGFVTGNIADAMLAASLAGALASVLVFNYNPASIFLGDSGSQLTGMLIGILSLRTLTTNNTFMLPVAYTILSLPVLDTFLCILRRISTFKPVYQGDLSHIHHRIRAKGFSVKTAVTFLWIAAAIGCIISINSFYTDKYVSFATSSVYLLACFGLAVKIGCLSIHKLLYRWRINIQPATTIDRFDEIESLWERMKPLFEKIRLDRAVLTLEGVNSSGRPEYKTLQWVRNTNINSDFPSDCWTTRFYLDKDEREMVILQLETLEKNYKDEQRVNWLLNRISDNMRMANSHKKVVLEENEETFSLTISE